MKKIYTLIALFFGLVMFGQDGILDSSFNTLDIGNGNGNGFFGSTTIYKTIIQSDGKIVAFGECSSYNTTIINKIVRLNTNGYIDNSFTTNIINGVIYSAAIQTNGKILIVGTFTTINGISQNRLARLNSDGTLDTAFNIGFGANDYINDLFLLDNGKIILCGNFTNYNGNATTRLARINNDGTIDSTFTIGTGFNLETQSAAIQPDGKLIIVGDFTNFNGNLINRITRLNADGSLDTSFNVGIGSDGYINTVQLQQDGKILIGGTFNNFNGNAKAKLCRLNSDGSIDTTFNSPGVLNNTVATIQVLPDNKIIVSGNFTVFSPNAVKSIVRLTDSGALDPTFLINSNPLAITGFILSTALQNDGKLIITGNFAAQNIILRSCILRLNIDGSFDDNFNKKIGANDLISCVEIQTDNKIVIGGNFTNFNNTNSLRIARLNVDGAIDNTFLTGTGFNVAPNVITKQSDGKLLLAGNFTTYNGITVNSIVRLNTDGSLDMSFSSGTGTIGLIRNIYVQATGKIFICGNFTSYNGAAVGLFRRLNSDGTLDTTFNSSNTGMTFGDVFCVREQTDGKIIVAGELAVYNATGIKSIIRLNIDGTLDNTFNPGNGPNTNINTLEIQADGKIIIGGNFTSYATFNSSRIARINANGSLDTSFNVGTGLDSSLNSIALQTDGKVIISGNFTTYNGVSANRIVRLNVNGSIDSSFNYGTAANGLISRMKMLPDNKLIIVGSFTSYNGIGKNRIARLNNTNLLDVKYNKSSIKSKFTIYPNPTNSILNIETKEKITSISIINIFGKKTNITNFENNKIDVSNFQNGVYFIEIATESGRKVEKFIKN